MQKYFILLFILSFAALGVDPRSWCNMANSGKEFGVETVYLTASAKEYDVAKEDEEVYRAVCKDVAADLAYIVNTPSVCVGLERGALPYAMDTYTKVDFDPSYCLGYKIFADYKQNLKDFFNPAIAKQVGGLSYSKKALESIMGFFQKKCSKERGKPLAEYQKCISLSAHRYFDSWGYFRERLLGADNQKSFCKLLEEPSSAELAVFNTMKKKSCPSITKSFAKNFCSLAKDSSRAKELMTQVKGCLGEALVKASDNYPGRKTNGLNRTPLLTQVLAMDITAQKIDMYQRICHAGLRFNAPFDKEVQKIEHPLLKEYCLDDTYQQVSFARSFNELLRDKEFLKFKALESPQELACELDENGVPLPEPVGQEHLEVLRAFATAAMSRDPNRRPEAPAKVSKINFTQENVEKTIKKALVSLSQNKSFNSKQRGQIGALAKNKKYLERTAAYYYDKYKFKKEPGEKKLELAINDYGKALIKFVAPPEKKVETEKKAAGQKEKSLLAPKPILKQIAEFKIPNPDELAKKALENYRKGVHDTDNMGYFVLAKDKKNKAKDFILWNKKINAKPQDKSLPDLLRFLTEKNPELALAYLNQENQDPEWVTAFEARGAELVPVLYNKKSNKVIYFDHPEMVVSTINPVYDSHLIYARHLKQNNDQDFVIYKPNFESEPKKVAKEKKADKKSKTEKTGKTKDKVKGSTAQDFLFMHALNTPKKSSELPKRKEKKKEEETEEEDDGASIFDLPLGLLLSNPIDLLANIDKLPALLKHADKLPELMKAMENQDPEVLKNLKAPSDEQVEEIEKALESGDEKGMVEMILKNPNVDFSKMQLTPKMVDEWNRQSTLQEMKKEQVERAKGSKFQEKLNDPIKNPQGGRIIVMSGVEEKYLEYTYSTGLDINSNSIVKEKLNLNDPRSLRSKELPLKAGDMEEFANSGTISVFHDSAISSEMDPFADHYVIGSFTNFLSLHILSGNQPKFRTSIRSRLVVFDNDADPPRPDRECLTVIHPADFQNNCSENPGGVYQDYFTFSNGAIAKSESDCNHIMECNFNNSEPQYDFQLPPLDTVTMSTKSFYNQVSENRRPAIHLKQFWFKDKKDADAFEKFVQDKLSADPKTIWTNGGVDKAYEEYVKIMKTRRWKEFEEKIANSKAVLMIDEFTNNPNALWDLSNEDLIYIEEFINSISNLSLREISPDDLTTTVSPILFTVRHKIVSLLSKLTPPNLNIRDFFKNMPKDYAKNRYYNWQAFINIICTDRNAMVNIEYCNRIPQKIIEANIKHPKKIKTDNKTASNIPEEKIQMAFQVSPSSSSDKKSSGEKSAGIPQKPKSNTDFTTETSSFGNIHIPMVITEGSIEDATFATTPTLPAPPEENFSLTIDISRPKEESKKAQKDAVEVEPLEAGLMAIHFLTVLEKREDRSPEFLQNFFSTYFTDEVTEALHNFFKSQTNGQEFYQNVVMYHLLNVKDETLEFSKEERMKVLAKERGIALKYIRNYYKIYDDYYDTLSRLIEDERRVTGKEKVNFSYYNYKGEEKSSTTWGDDD